MKKMSTISRTLIAVASAGMIAVFFLPVWAIYLVAPQYPEGLEMNIWLTKITGQVDIINGLNHYIGMKHISADMFPEFGYMKYILAGFIVYGLLVAIIGSRKFLLSLLVLTVALAGAALYDFYQWGYDYGHNLDPNAAIKVPGFSYQPPVIGHKTLLNFDAYSYPDTGGWIITISGAIFFLVYFYEWYKSRKQVQQTPSSLSTSKAKVAVATLAVVLISSCNTQPEPFVIGKDLCEDCKMTIMEPQFGAEIITTKGRIFKFDDLHCVVNYINKDKIAQNDIKQTVAVDYNNPTQFVNVSEASFVTSPQLKSPMNSNTAAFATKEAAAKVTSQTGGTLKDWNSVLKP
ncbi:MAG TPA: nitrous oxide reductase accessory protein NosL [Flavisolibacter sp.]|jgi:copper chaperone NosL|nr:nitrous oxide reductase accessory protein NosL [Flavisolibacter sp.]